MPLSSTQKTEIEPLVSYDSKGTRLTCVTFADGTMESVDELSIGGKRKLDDNDDGHADEDGESESDDSEIGDDDDDDEEEEELQNEEEEEEEESS